jgi:hypothetical protein
MLRHLTMKNPESNTDESSSRHYLLQGAQLASKQSQALQAGARSVKKKKYTPQPLEGK